MRSHEYKNQMLLAHHLPFIYSVSVREEGCARVLAHTHHGIGLGAKTDACRLRELQEKGKSTGHHFCGCMCFFFIYIFVSLFCASLALGHHGSADGSRR